MWLYYNHLQICVTQTFFLYIYISPFKLIRNTIQSALQVSEKTWDIWKTRMDL